MVMPIGLPEDVTLWPTATKSPLGAATTQSPVNVPVVGADGTSPAKGAILRIGRDDQITPTGRSRNHGDIPRRIRCDSRCLARTGRARVEASCRPQRGQSRGSGSWDAYRRDKKKRYKERSDPTMVPPNTTVGHGWAHHIRRRSRASPHEQKPPPIGAAMTDIRPRYVNSICLVIGRQSVLVVVGPYPGPAARRQGQTARRAFGSAHTSRRRWTRPGLPSASWSGRWSRLPQARSSCSSSGKARCRKSSRTR